MGMPPPIAESTSHNARLRQLWTRFGYLAQDDVAAHCPTMTSDHSENGDRPICRICWDSEGVRNSKTLERLIDHPMHKAKYLRIVCANCWEHRRETPVTCKMFGRL